jgi:hypothetical protein
MSFLSSILNPLIGSSSSNNDNESVLGAVGGLLDTAVDDVVQVVENVGEGAADSIESIDTYLSQGGSASGGASGSGGSSSGGGGGITIGIGPGGISVGGSGGASGGSGSAGGTGGYGLPPGGGGSGGSGGYGLPSPSGNPSPQGGGLPPPPSGPVGSDVASVASYETAEEEYNEMVTMYVQMNQDNLQTVGSQQNSIAQTATSVAQESQGTSIAAATARSKNVDSQTQEVTQA